MHDTQMGPIEARFADLIWQNEPISAADLARLGFSELKWKKTTCYTVLRRLCEKGIFENSGGTVTSVLSREEFDTLRSHRFVEDTFDGSLPTFLAAFAAGKPLTEDEIAALRQMVAAYDTPEEQ